MKHRLLSTSTIVIIVLMVAMVIRMLFAIYKPMPLLTADTKGYYELGLTMIKNPSLETLISEFRTPLYPIFLASLSNILGFHGESMYDSLFTSVGYTIADVQSIAGIVGILLFVSLLIRMEFSNRTFLIISLLSTLNIFVFYWERSLLTEGLATTTLVFSVILFAQTIKAPNTKNFILLWMSYGVNFLLRPAFLFLPIVTLPFLFISCKKQSEKIKVFVTIVCSCLVPTLYILGNNVYHHYNGIQHVGDIDILGRILEFDTPIEKGKQYTYFYENVTDYRKRNGNPMPFEFINTYDDSMYTNTMRMNQLQGFTRSVVFYEFPSYLMHAFSTIPQAIRDVSPFIKIEGLGSLHIFFSGLLAFYTSLLPFTLVAFPLYPVSLYLLYRKASVRRILLAAIGSIIISQIVLTVLVVYREDYGRLFASIQPFIFVFIIGTLQELFKKDNEGVAIL